MRAIVLVVVGSLSFSRQAGAQPAPASPTAATPAPEVATAPVPAAAPATAVVATPAVVEGETAAPSGESAVVAPAAAPAVPAANGGEATASAQASSGSLTFAGITISGLLDAYATINPARTATNAAPNDLYVFETQANGASVSLAKIALERKPAPVGFRLDVGFGQTIDIVNATDTAAGMGHDIMRNLEQAYVSWAATK
ncbi:MAG TPA: outer membrane beta-barrel protein, partial [Kofleriaceae bacterium]